HRVESAARPAGKLRASWSGLGGGERLWFLGTLASIRVRGDASGGCRGVVELLWPRPAASAVLWPRPGASYGRLGVEVRPTAGEGVGGGRPERGRDRRARVMPDHRGQHETGTEACHPRRLGLRAADPLLASVECVACHDSSL